MELTTQKQIRAEFWASHPHCKKRVVSVGCGMLREATQNEYPTDTRIAFCDYVENMRRSGYISDALAIRVTL